MNNKQQKIVQFQPRNQEHSRVDLTVEQAKEIRAKFFRGEISVEDYYQQAQLNRRGKCPNCGQYH